MPSAPREENRVPGLVGASSSNERIPVVIYADPTTHRLLVNATGTIGLQGLQIGNYDYVANTSTSTSDTFRFYSGGSGGSLVATVALVYTDTTKGTIFTVTKT